MALLAVKNEDICQVIREKGVCKDWVWDLCWELQMESVAAEQRGLTGGTVSVGAELCHLKKRY